MLTTETPAGINHPELLRSVNHLRRFDNTTNWFYLLREYLYLGLVIFLAVTFYDRRELWGLAWLWNVPVTALAVFLVGVGQHRLITLAHEASHYMLFRNRWLNELASDFFCMFPLFSVTHNYRLQHLAHHQFVNDPERDPDLIFMRESGHEYHFPMPRLRFWWKCILRPFFWLPGLFRYMGIRARYTTAGGGTGPYRPRSLKSKLLVRVGIFYLVALVLTLAGLVWLGNARLLLFVPALMLAAVLTFYVLVPENLYPHTIVRPCVTPRWWTVLRMTYATGLFTALALLTHYTGRPWALYYLLLWALPLATSFAYLMILREAVQHGDLGQERFAHTRNFQGSPLIRWAVFPLGMNYHLPHHCFPMVPHYRLDALHRLLLEAESYAQGVIVVEGRLVPSSSTRSPAVLTSALDTGCHATCRSGQSLATEPLRLTRQARGA